MSSHEQLKLLCQRLVANQFDTIHDAEQALEQFEQLATPGVVLALIADKERIVSTARLARVWAEMKVHEEVGRSVTSHLLVILERDQLKAFAREMINACYEGGSFDGGDIQDIAVKQGLLGIEHRTEECGEACACREYGFPAECYRKTGVLVEEANHEAMS